LVFDYADLFSEVGASLADAALSKEALRFYEAIEGMDEYSTDATVHLAMAKCYRALQLDKKAEECYRLAIRNDDKTVEARVQLAKLLEELKRPEEAYKYVSEAVLLERRKIQAKIGKAAPGARGNLMHLDSTKKRVQFNRATRVQIPNLEVLAQKHPRVAALATEDSSPARGSPPAEGFGTSRPQRERDRKRRLSEVDPTTRGTHPRKAPKSMDAEAERDGTAQTLYNTLLVYQDGMRKGDSSATEAWLDAADTLLRDFRSNRVFYPWERHQRFLGYTQDALRMSNRRKHLKQSDTEEMTVMAQRLHSTLTTAESGAPPSVIPTTYRGLSFASWLDIFLEYAFVSAKIGDAAESYDALTSATDANVFYHSKSGMSIIHAVYFTCALLLHDEETLLNIARVFISGGSTTHNLSPSTPRPTHNAPSTANALPFRHQSSIYAILARAHSHKNPVTWYNAGPNQKYILRQIKQMDTHLQTLRPSDPSSAAPGAPNSTIMSSFDLPITLMYGHMLSTAASHTNALAYYLRAYSINPSHPLILLSIALAYIHWSLKRQAGNRHYLILQGSYFLNKYHTLRSQSALLHERQEAEYNVGRVWHMLSCTELAIPHYEKALSLGKEMDEEAAKRRAVREATKAIRAGLSVQDIIEKAGAAYSDTVDDGGPQAKAHISLQLTPEEMAIAEEKIAQYRQTHSKGKSSHAHQNTQNGSLTPAISSEANREHSNGIEFPKDEDKEDESEAFTESFTSHAALCLALIYAGSSSAERAREITDEWLTLC
jgi:general transcription factor 3C polypeptide 3 (transcription factor C subunit 4)